MRKTAFRSVLFCALVSIQPLFVACTHDGRDSEILLVVEDRLAGQLAESLTQLAADIRAEGNTVQQLSLSASSPPAAIRTALQQRWEAAPKLRGAIFIGELQAPSYRAQRLINDPYWHDQLVDLYYMDLDGAWQDRNGDGVLDAHRSYSGTIGRVASLIVDGLPWVDRREPEIWVSRIRAGTLHTLGAELALYQDYFRRNHAYRTKSDERPPERAMVISPGAHLTKSDWGARPERLYKDVQAVECSKDASEQLRAKLADPRGWALGVIGSFSGPQVHKLHYYEGGGIDEQWFQSAGGRLLLAQYSEVENAPWDLTSHDVARIRPRILFYHLLSSETGRHDYAGYIGGAYLFFGSGLGVIAGTQHSGAIGVPMLYDEFAAGKSLGDAWRSAIEWSLRPTGDKLVQRWCKGDNVFNATPDVYKAVLLGDGTLHLPN